MTVSFISNSYRRNIFLIAEYNSKRFSLENIMAKNPLAQVLQIFNKCITFKIDVLFAGVVDFNPRRIIAFFIVPVHIQRRNFRYTQSRFSNPTKSGIGRKLNINRNQNSIATGIHNFYIFCTRGIRNTWRTRRGFRITCTTPIRSCALTTGFIRTVKISIFIIISTANNKSCTKNRSQRKNLFNPFFWANHGDHLK